MGSSNCFVCVFGVIPRSSQNDSNVVFSIYVVDLSLQPFCLRDKGDLVYHLSINIHFDPTVLALLFIAYESVIVQLQISSVATVNKRSDYFANVL